jgi:hypothetical protein
MIESADNCGPKTNPPHRHSQYKNAIICSTRKKSCKYEPMSKRAQFKKSATGIRSRLELVLYDHSKRVGDTGLEPVTSCV